MPQSHNNTPKPPPQPTAEDAAPYRTLASRTIWQSRWYALREDQVRFPDGSEGTYTVVEKDAAVYVVPLTADGQMVLLRNYRYTVDRWLWEVPAGGVQPGVEPEEMARRELREETGGQAERLQRVGSFYTMPGLGTEIIHVYVAYGVTLGEPDREPSEVMECHVVPLADALRMASKGEMGDGLSTLAILASMPYLQADSTATESIGDGTGQ